MDNMYLVAWKTEDYGEIFTKCSSWREVEEVKTTLSKCNKVRDISICQIIEHIENVTEKERYKLAKGQLSSTYGMVVSK